MGKIFESKRTTFAFLYLLFLTVQSGFALGGVEAEIVLQMVEYGGYTTMVLIGGVSAVDWMMAKQGKKQETE